MFKMFFLFTLLLCFNLMDGEEPIVVKLETQAKLYPIAISKIQRDNSAFDAAYLAELEKILKFDLDHNGLTKVTNAKANQYSLKIKSKDKSITAEAQIPSSQLVKVIDPIPLSGDLRFDRRQIHLLADSICHALFNTKGIASTRLLYTLKMSGKASEVYECDYDGGNPRQLTHDGYCVTPLYIPPKEGAASGSFLYVSYKNGQPKIYIASLKDGKGRRFTTMRGNQLLPTVSLQRDKIAFINDITGNPDLFLQPFSSESGPIGKPQQIFSHGKSTQGSSTFSPDGTNIAFVSNKDGSPKIYVMPLPKAGTNIKLLKPKLISKANRESTAPSWSPDGTKLAYCASTDGIRQIWIYDFDKDAEWQLTFGSENKENPTWAPNSLHLAFNSTGKSKSELYIVNLNQPEAVKITSGPGEKRFPNWEPQ